MNMQIIDQNESLIFLGREESIFVFNQLTGLYFEINQDMKDLLINWEEMKGIIDGLPEIKSYLEDTSLTIKLMNDELIKELYPKINPYSVWNHEYIVYPYKGTYNIGQCSPFESSVFEKCNGQYTCEEISEQLGCSLQTLIPVLEKWVKYEYQVLKLFKNQFQESDIRYFQLFFDDIPSHEEDPLIDLEEYYNQVDCAWLQFEHIETTVSYLLREKTELLSGLSYGNLFSKFVLEETNGRDGVLKILEVGGGIGHFAQNFLEYYGDNAACDFSYTICDLSPKLLESQKKICQAYQDKMMFVHGRGEKLPFEPRSFDCVISNEVIADFISVKVGQANEEHAYSDEVRRVINTYDLGRGDEVYYLNLGAILFLERVEKVLRPGGLSIISEYTELDCNPQISRFMSDHKEVSIDFNVLHKVAQKLGFDVKLVSLTEFLELDNTVQILNPVIFSPLKLLLSKYGLALSKKIYGKSLLDQQLEEYNIKNLNYVPLGQILGFFNILILKK